MVNNVAWSQKSLRQMREIIAYRQSEVSEQSADNFVATFRKKLDGLKLHPEKGRKSPKAKTIQFINFDKYHRLYYRMNGTTLHIVEIWDMRRDPKKRKY